MARNRPCRLALALAAALSTLTACSTAPAGVPPSTSAGTGPERALDTVREAAARTLAAATARMELTVTSSAGEELLHLRGVLSLDGARSRITSSPRPGEQALEMRVIGDVTWIQRPDAPGWMRVAGAGLGPDDPIAILRLAAGVTGAHPVGPMLLKGEPTDGHSFELRLPGEPPVQVSLWTDRSGRARRLVIEGAAPGPAARTVLELFDFGVAIEVEAPPADQVLDVGVPDGGPVSPP